MDEQLGLEYMEDFANKFQSDKGAMGWVLELRQRTLIRMGKAKEAIAVENRIIELEPGDLEAAYRNVQIA